MHWQEKNMLGSSLQSIPVQPQIPEIQHHAR
uniref:Uncharacterized protein n=1 Tax=Arundo donax TaxID=35708 RepID=A0A0A8YZB2_ARUDO